MDDMKTWNKTEAKNNENTYLTQIRNNPNIT
jgi:hypothetical protein